MLRPVFLFEFPLGTLFRRPAEFGTPARRAFSPSRRGVASICRPAGTPFRPPAKLGTPARRAARRGRLWGCARQSDAKHRVAGLGRHRRYARRSERHGDQSLTARQCRDLLLISGRVDGVNTPAPLASPLREFSASVKRRGQRGCSCGSFLHSLHSFRRSPSAPRKCHSPLPL